MPQPHKKLVPQAAKLQAESKANISTKLNVLKGWVSHGIPYVRDGEGHTLLDENDDKKLDYYPTSISAFCRWNASQNCTSTQTDLPALRSTGRETISRDRELSERVKKVVTALKQRAKTQESETNSSLIKTLQEKLRCERLARENVEIDNVAVRKEFRQIKRKYQKIIDQSQSDSDEFHRALSHAEAEIQKLRKDKADIVRQLAKLTPLKQQG